MMEKNNRKLAGNKEWYKQQTNEIDLTSIQFHLERIQSQYRVYKVVQHEEKYWIFFQELCTKLEALASDASIFQVFYEKGQYFFFVQKQSQFLQRVEMLLFEYGAIFYAERLDTVPKEVLLQFCLLTMMDTKSGIVSEFYIGEWYKSKKYGHLDMYYTIRADIVTNRKVQKHKQKAALCVKVKTFSNIELFSKEKPSEEEAAELDELLEYVEYTPYQELSEEEKKRERDKSERERRVNKYYVLDGDTVRRTYQIPTDCVVYTDKKPLKYQKHKNTIIAWDSNELNKKTEKKPIPQYGLVYLKLMNQLKHHSLIQTIDFLEEKVFRFGNPGTYENAFFHLYREMVQLPITVVMGTSVEHADFVFQQFSRCYVETVKKYNKKYKIDLPVIQPVRQETPGQYTFFFIQNSETISKYRKAHKLFSQSDLDYFHSQGKEKQYVQHIGVDTAENEAGILNCLKELLYQEIYRTGRDEKNILPKYRKDAQYRYYLPRTKMQGGKLCVVGADCMQIKDDSISFQTIQESDWEWDELSFYFTESFHPDYKDTIPEYMVQKKEDGKNEMMVVYRSHIYAVPEVSLHEKIESMMEVRKNQIDVEEVLQLFRQMRNEIFEGKKIQPVKEEILLQTCSFYTQKQKWKACIETLYPMSESVSMKKDRDSMINVEVEFYQMISKLLTWNDSTIELKQIVSQKRGSIGKRVTDYIQKRLETEWEEDAFELSIPFKAGDFINQTYPAFLGLTLAECKSIPVLDEETWMIGSYFSRIDQNPTDGIKAVTNLPVKRDIVLLADTEELMLDVMNMLYDPGVKYRQLPSRPTPIKCLRMYQEHRAIENILDVK